MLSLTTCAVVFEVYELERQHGMLWSPGCTLTVSGPLKSTITPLATHFRETGLPL